jgi:putative SOS response-associated peptidase YedK
MCYYNSISIQKGTKVALNGTTKELPAIQRPIQSGFEYGDWAIIKAANNDVNEFDNEKDIDFIFELAHWELIAPWVNSTLEVMKGREKFNTLNATAERLFESRLFKQPALKRRCLVLSSGFYEWRHFTPPGAKKDIAYPYHITLKDKPYFFMAGIYQPWVDIESGEMMDTFSIITTKANALMEQIHNKKKRMPTILNEQQAAKWLQPNLKPSEIMGLATTQVDPSLLEVHTLKKDFRTANDPKEAFYYEELEALNW